MHLGFEEWVLFTENIVFQIFINYHFSPRVMLMHTAFEPSGMTDHGKLDGKIPGLQTKSLFGMLASLRASVISHIPP
jgi:hypothetical protein